MTEQQVPYQAGEAPAEKPLSQVAYEAFLTAAWPYMPIARYASDWQEISKKHPAMVAEYQAIARAVQAEDLRRAVAHLEALWDARAVLPESAALTALGYRRAIKDLRAYAARESTP